MQPVLGQANNSILAVSKADLIGQLSPMKSFMVERSAQKQSNKVTAAGISEYMIASNH